MKDMIVNNSLKLITTYYNFDDRKLKRIKYGFEGLYITLSKLLVTILIGIIFNSFKETILLLLLFGPLKNFGFGIHASKGWQCWITTIPVFCGIPILAKYYSCNNSMIFIGIISAIIIMIYAPADTKKRPLKKESQRQFYKIMEIIICSLYIYIILNYNNLFSFLIIHSLIIEAILINPITYRIFKQPYSNYKLSK